jgi:hypothetical protein
MKQQIESTKTMLVPKPISSNAPSDPPSHPILWWAGLKGTDRFIVMRSQSAFLVIAKAMVRQKLERHEVTLIKGTRDGVTIWNGNNGKPTYFSKELGLEDAPPAKQRRARIARKRKRKR